MRLDGETIDEIAEALVARGVPVLLATGYEKAQLPPSLQHLPRVRKPYDERELRGLLERALSLGAGPESPIRIEGRSALRRALGQSFALAETRPGILPRPRGLGLTRRIVR